MSEPTDDKLTSLSQRILDDESCDCLLTADRMVILAKGVQRLMRERNTACQLVDKLGELAKQRIAELKREIEELVSQGKQEPGK